MAARVAAMDGERVQWLITQDRCPYEPQHLQDVALGMFHCPLCGEMLIAGMGHPRAADEDYADLDRSNAEHFKRSWPDSEWFRAWLRLALN